MIVTLVPKELYSDVFNKIQPYLESAAEYTFGRFKAEDIKRGLLVKPQQLWVAFDGQEVYGFVVTEIYSYPQLTALVMHFTAGKKLPRWKDAMLKELRDFSKEHKCTIIESYGRRGWAKVFQNDGYKEQFTFYELPVEN